jgi:hypothetical protein
VCQFALLQNNGPDEVEMFYTGQAGYRLVSQAQVTYAWEIPV